MARSAMDEANPPAPGPVPVPALSASLTRNQIRGFWASWGGWTLDGMDSFVYALVLVPSLRELLPHSGIAATKANIGQYGGLLFALFLVGWGLAFLWGPVGRQVRPRAHAHADHRVVLGVHVSERLRYQRVATCLFCVCLRA